MANGNGTFPDVHGKATAEALAVTTISIYIANVLGLDIPGEVAAAITTLAGVAFGILRGDKYRAHARREGDTVK